MPCGFALHFAGKTCLDERLHKQEYLDGGLLLAAKVTKNRFATRKAPIALSNDASSLTALDLEFLRRPLHGFLSIAGHTRPSLGRCGSRPLPKARSNLFTSPDTLKVRRVRKDPRASIVVAAPVGERERWVSVAGRITVELDGAQDLAARLAARYWDLDDPVRAKDLAELLGEDQVRLVIHPEVVSRFAY